MRRGASISASILCVAALLSAALDATHALTQNANTAEAHNIEQQENSLVNTTKIKKHVRLRGAGEGKDFQWGKDHIFVKLHSAETGGALTLIQDNLKSGFDLGMHFHRTHTEIFYILEGQVDFVTDKTTFAAKAGSLVYLPAGTPHAASSSTGGSMLLFYAPGGFDLMLEEIENASWFQRINPIARARRDKKYDFNHGAENAPVDTGAPAPQFVPAKTGEIAAQTTGERVIKLASAATHGLAEIAVETLDANSKRPASSTPDTAEILYVLAGDLSFTVQNETRTAGKGATLFLPAGSNAQIHTTSGVRFLSYRGAF